MKFSVFAIFTLWSLSSQAQIFALGGEILPDTILGLEDLKAQCIHPQQRAVFEYAKSIKRVAWYRSEEYSEVDEEKLKILASGIVQRDTGKSLLRGYLDVRDIPIVSEQQGNPYILSRENFSGFYWASKPKPSYSERDCVAAEKKWLEAIPGLEQKLPPAFPEIKKLLDLAYLNDLVSISKRIGSCTNVHFSVDETYFEAWLSNNFSKAYGRREAVSRPIYKQLQRELRAFGAAADAAKRINFGRARQADCETLPDAINSYNHNVSAL